jgi:hypothetical protein
MAVVLLNVFRDNNQEYGNASQCVNLFFKRRAYFTESLHS